MTQMITSCQFQWPTVIQLFPLQEHLISLPVLNGVRATRSLVLCVMFCKSFFVLLSFFFFVVVVCPFSIYGF